MTTITDKLAAALRDCRETLAWYSVNAEGNSTENPDPDDIELVAAADAALAEYDAARAAVTELVECVAPLLASLKSRITQENAMTEQAVMVRRAFFTVRYGRGPGEWPYSARDVTKSMAAQLPDTHPKKES